MRTVTIRLLAIQMPNLHVPRMPTATTPARLRKHKRLTITNGARTTTNQFKLLRSAITPAADLQPGLMLTYRRTAESSGPAGGDIAERSSLNWFVVVLAPFVI